MAPSPARPYALAGVLGALALLAPAVIGEVGLADANQSISGPWLTLGLLLTGLLALVHTQTERA